MGTGCLSGLGKSILHEVFQILHIYHPFIFVKVMDLQRPQTQQNKAKNALRQINPQMTCRSGDHIISIFVNF